MDYLWVGIGGVLGGLCRFQAGRSISQRADTDFPLGTFCINLVGALLLGLLSSLEAPKTAYLLLGEGFCGAFTTFSTFMYEGFGLLQNWDSRNAVLYLGGTVVLGLVGYCAGYALGS